MEKERLASGAVSELLSLPYRAVISGPPGAPVDMLPHDMWPGPVTTDGRGRRRPVMVNKYGEQTPRKTAGECSQGIKQVESQIGETLRLELKPSGKN